MASMEKEGVWRMQGRGTGLLSSSDVLYMQARGSFNFLSVAHAALQGNIEDSHEEKAAARDASRERKRRRRYAQHHPCALPLWFVHRNDPERPLSLV